MVNTQRHEEPEATPSLNPGTRTAGSRLRSAWTLLKQAVQGTQQDYTEGGLKRAVFLLSVPMILEMVNMAFLLGVMVVFLVWTELLIAAFTSDPAAQALGANCLRVVSYGYAFYAWGLVLVQAFNGAGDTVTPTWINLGCYWCFQVPLALLLARGLDQMSVLSRRTCSRDRGA